MPSRVSLDWLRRKRALVLISAFLVATLIETLVHWHAPPNVMWMSIMAISVYLLFEVGLFFAQLFLKE
jgi:Sec-independent protein secretion pathway component TatC